MPPVISSPHRKTTFVRRRLLITAVILVILRGTPVSCAVTPLANDPAAAQLSQEMFAVHPGSSAEAAASVYRSLYWTYASLQPGLPVGMAIMRAVILTNRTPGASQLEVQLNINFGVADSYGLFTPANLALLQSGATPTATRGPSSGKRIAVVKIRPNDPSYSLTNVALCAENTPLTPGAVAPGSWPGSPAGAGQRVLAPTATMATTVPTASTQTPPPTPAPYRMPNGAMVYPGTFQVSLNDSSEPKIQLSELPFNGLLPINGIVKLGIAGVQGIEITVAIVGERQVILQGPVGSRNTSHPSVDKVKVTKTNPVRLPGISANAYLIHRIPAGPNGPELSWYFVDANVDNGMVFRIARVIGPL